MGRWLGKRNEEKAQERFILSVDGGGIRGIVPSAVLSFLAEKLKQLGDTRPLYSHFDLIAGTSTGALLALGLCISDPGIKRDKGEETPVTERVRTGLFRRTDRVLGYIQRAGDPCCFTQLYLENAKKIFSQKGRVFSSLFSEKYDSSSLEDFLLSAFRQARLEDALVPVMVVCYDSLSGQGVILSSYNEWKEMKACSAARASSAAPLYFSPYYTLTPQGREAALLDGGLIANDPALLAYAQARRLYPDCRCFHILSLSTARNVYTFNPKESINGLAGWAEPVMKMYPNAQFSLTDMTLSCLDDVQLLRIKGQVTKEKIRLDDTRKESLDALVEGGRTLCGRYDSELSDFARQLSLRTDFSHVRLAGEHRLLTQEP